MLTQKMIDDIRMNLTSDSFVECIKVTWRKAQDEILHEWINWLEGRIESKNISLLASDKLKELQFRKEKYAGILTSIRRCKWKKK